MSNLRIVLADTPTMLSEQDEERCNLVAEKKEEESKRKLHLSPRKRYPSSSLPVKKRCREHNGASTTNLCCFETFGNSSLYNYNTPETEKKIELPSPTAVQSSSTSSSTIGKIRLYLKQKKSTDGFNKAKVDPLPMKYPPSSNDVESSSPSCTSDKRINVEQNKRKSGSKKPKIAPNTCFESKR